MSDEELRGVVEKVLPNRQFQVALDDGRTVVAHLSGKAKRRRRLTRRARKGQQVLVELSPADPSRGRILGR